MKMTAPTGRTLRHAAAAMAACVLATPTFANALPDGIAPDEWQQVEAALRAENGLPPPASFLPASEATAGITDVHGLVRTHVVVGDFSDLPAQGENGPEFGYSIAADGDWLAVGAPGTRWTHATHGTADHGAVFLFHRSGGGWTLHQRITVTNSPAGSRCGHAVALRMPYVAFGCPETDNASGTQRPGWTRVWRQADTMGQFAASSGHPGYADGRCGFSLAMTRNYLAVGCPTALRASDSLETGSVVIHRRNDLTGVFGAEETLAPSGNFAGARFGHAVAMFESPSPGFPPLTVRLAVGAPNRVYAGDVLPSGAVYMYSRPLNTADWSLTTGLTLASASNHLLSGFGTALAMNRTQLVVGAPNNAVAGSGLPGPGTAHRYQLDEVTSGWAAMEVGNAVNLPDGFHGGMRFGGAVAIGFDSLIAIGAPRTGGTFTGGAAADEVGLVELRRSSEGYSVNGYQGEVRPAPLGALALDEGHLGHSLAFSVNERRMFVGYPRTGITLAGAGRRGAVWVYQDDRIFADGFQLP